MAATNSMGPARNRVDGKLKVSGGAKYAVEFILPNCAYAWPVESNIAKGKILSIDTGAAEKAPEVLTVLTHKNIPKPKNAQGPEERNSGKGIRNEHRLPLSDDEVHYAGQYVAMVVAKTIEQARNASSLVGVSYAPDQPILRMDDATKDAKKPDKNHGDPVQISKGDLDAVLKRNDLVKTEQTYVTPVETHNPIEMSGTIAWPGPGTFLPKTSG
jgi:xanthine dehydrogenase YagR molybdenum-binding subunit